MRIERDTGTVSLPNGFIITASLTLDDFQASAVFSRARRPDREALPWNHYQFSGGAIDGKELLVGVLFYEQLLVSICINANLYPPNAIDWSSYSLDVEAATKEFHERLLKQSLGDSAESECHSFSHLTERQAVLGCPCAWVMSWGTVHSQHDFKGGGTSVEIMYGNRFVKANKAYRRLHPARG